MKKLYYRILLLLGAVAAVIFITDRTGIFEGFQISRTAQNVIVYVSKCEVLLLCLYP